MVSALSLLAERPNLLAAVMPTRTVNAAGAYQVMSVVIRAMSVVIRVMSVVIG
jgi:hypothetical protein